MLKVTVRGSRPGRFDRISRSLHFSVFLAVSYTILSFCQIFIFILFVLLSCFSGLFLVQEMLQYSFLTATRKLLIVLGLWYVVVGVFIFADSEVLVIMEDIKGN